MKNHLIHYGDDRIKSRQRTSFLLLFILFILIAELTKGQDMYVSPNSNFFVHGGSVGIFSNVTNAGNMGSKPGAVVKFMGLKWTNDSLATMPDETSYKKGSSVPTSFNGSGGMFWFSNSHQSQLLSGGYRIGDKNTTGFPNLQIDNPNGIYLAGSSDVEIRKTLNFVNGKIWANGNNLKVGDTDPGTITGYSEKNYVVTGNAVTGGFLYRANLNNASGQIVFPVGADDVYYTPAIVAYKGTAQDFRVRPFNMKSANILNRDNNDSGLLQTTWNIGKSFDEIAEMDVYLDNPPSLEGSVFSKNNSSAYITHYDRTVAVWDTIKKTEIIASSFYNIHLPGHNKVLNGRRFVRSFEQNEFFSKSVSSVYTVPERIGLAESASLGVLQMDKSYNVALNIIVENNGLVDLNSVTVSNNLRKTLAYPISFKVLSLSATGSLLPNLNFDGLEEGDTTLLMPSSQLLTKQSDTIHLLINLQNVKNPSNSYYNSSFAYAQSALTGNFVRTASSSGINTELEIAATPIYLHSPSNESIPVVVLMNNPSIVNQFVLKSLDYIERLNWQLVDYNGKPIQFGEFRDLMKGTVHIANTPILSKGIYFIKLNADGKLLTTLKWIKL